MALTLGQRIYYTHLMDPRVQLVVVTGPSGSGKTHLATKTGQHNILIKKYDKIIMTRPAISVDEENHGFIPGTIEKKMKPWLKPITDMADTRTKMEISPLAYMRGLTFNNSWVIADEMQNSTQSQMKMLLTRIGKNSKMVITGDVTQSDRQCDGLSDLVKRIKRGEIPDTIKLIQMSSDDVVRSEIVKDILKLYL